MCYVMHEYVWKRPTSLKWDTQLHGIVLYFSVCPRIFLDWNRMYNFFLTFWLGYDSFFTSSSSFSSASLCIHINIAVDFVLWLIFVSPPHSASMLTLMCLFIIMVKFVRLFFASHFLSLSLTPASDAYLIPGLRWIERDVCARAYCVCVCAPANIRQSRWLLANLWCGFCYRCICAHP